MSSSRKQSENGSFSTSKPVSPTTAAGSSASSPPGSPPFSSNADNPAESTSFSTSLENYNGFLADFGPLDAQRRTILELLQQHNLSHFKKTLETTFHCMAGTNSTKMGDVTFYHLCYHAKLVELFPEDTDEVSAAVKHQHSKKSIEPFLIRNIFSFATQGQSHMTVAAFFLAICHCGHVLIKQNGGRGKDVMRSSAETVSAMMLQRIVFVDEHHLTQFVKVHSTSYPFPEAFFRNSMPVARILWKFSEGLEDVFDRYVDDGDEMSLGAFETCFTEFGIIPQVPLATMHKIFFASCTGGYPDHAAAQTLGSTTHSATLNFDKFLESVARIACEVLSDDTFARWLTLDAKLQHFLTTIFGSAYANFFNRALPKEELDPPHPYVNGVSEPVISEEGSMVTVRGRYFGALGRGVWFYDSASDKVQHIAHLPSDEGFDVQIRPGAKLEWQTATLKEVEAEGVVKFAFSLQYSSPIHVAAANSPEDLPFFAPLVSVSTLEMKCMNIQITAGCADKLANVFRDGCRKSSAYNTNFLYEQGFRFLCARLMLSCGDVNTKALGLGDKDEDEDDEDNRPFTPAEDAQLLNLFNSLATRRRQDASARPALTVSSWVEIMVRICLSKGVPNSMICAEIDKILEEDVQRASIKKEAETENSAQNRDGEEEPSSPAGAASSSSGGRARSVKIDDSAAGGGGPFSSGSSAQPSFAGGRRGTTIRDETLMRNMAMERKQSIALGKSHQHLKRRVDELQKRLSQWGVVRAEMCQGLLEIRNFCDLLLTSEGDKKPGIDGKPPELSASLNALESALNASTTPQDSNSAQNQKAAELKRRTLNKLAGVYKNQLLGVCDRVFSALQLTDSVPQPGEEDSDNSGSSSDDDADGEGKKKRDSVTGLEMRERPCLDRDALRSGIDKILKEAHQHAQSTFRRQEFASGTGSQNKFEIMEQLAVLEDGERRSKAEVTKLEKELKKLKHDSKKEADKLLEDMEAVVNAKQTAEKNVNALQVVMKDKDKQMQKMKLTNDANVKKIRSYEDTIEARQAQNAKFMKDIKELQNELAHAKFQLKEAEKQLGPGGRRLSMTEGSHPQSHSPGGKGGGRGAGKHSHVASLAQQDEKLKMMKASRDSAERRFEELQASTENQGKELAELKKQAERDHHEKQYLRSEKEHLEKLLQTVERWSQVGYRDVDFLRQALSAFRAEGQLPAAPTSSSAGENDVTYVQAKNAKDGGEAAGDKEGAEGGGEGSLSEPNTGVRKIKKKIKKGRKSLSNAASHSDFDDVEDDSFATPRTKTSTNSRLSRKGTSAKKKISRKQSTVSTISKRSSQGSRPSSRMSSMSNSKIFSEDDNDHDTLEISIEITDSSMQTDAVIVLDPTSNPATVVEESKCNKCVKNKFALRAMQSAAVKVDFTTMAVRDDLTLLRHQTNVQLQQFKKHMQAALQGVVDAAGRVRPEGLPTAEEEEARLQRARVLSADMSVQTEEEHLQHPAEGTTSLPPREATKEAHAVGTGGNQTFQEQEHEEMARAKEAAAAAVEETERLVQEAAEIRKELQQYQAAAAAAKVEEKGRLKQQDEEQPTGRAAAEATPPSHAASPARKESCTIAVGSDDALPQVLEPIHHSPARLVPVQCRDHGTQASLYVNRLPCKDTAAQTVGSIKEWMTSHTSSPDQSGSVSGVPSRSHSQAARKQAGGAADRENELVRNSTERVVSGQHFGGSTQVDAVAALHQLDEQGSGPVQNWTMTSPTSEKQKRLTKSMKQRIAEEEGLRNERERRAWLKSRQPQRYSNQQVVDEKDASHDPNLVIASSTNKEEEGRGREEGLPINQEEEEGTEEGKEPLPLEEKNVVVGHGKNTFGPRVDRSQAILRQQQQAPQHSGGGGVVPQAQPTAQHPMTVTSQEQHSMARHASSVNTAAVHKDKDRSVVSRVHDAYLQPPEVLDLSEGHQPRPGGSEAAGAVALGVQGTHMQGKKEPSERSETAASATPVEETATGAEGQFLTRASSSRTKGLPVSITEFTVEGQHLANQRGQHQATSQQPQQQQFSLVASTATPQVASIDGTTAAAASASTRYKELTPDQRKALIAQETAPGLSRIVGHNAIPLKADSNKVDARDKLHFLQEQVLYKDEGGHVVTKSRDEWLGNGALVAMGDEEEGEEGHKPEHFLKTPRQGTIGLQQHYNQQQQQHQPLTTPQGVLTGPKSRSTDIVPASAASMRPYTAPSPAQPLVGSMLAEVSGTPALPNQPLGVATEVGALASQVLSETHHVTSSGKKLVNVEAIPGPLKPRAPPAAGGAGPNSHLPPPSRLHSAGGTPNFSVKRTSGGGGGNTGRSASLSPRGGSARPSPSSKQQAQLKPIFKAPLTINTRKLKAKQKQILGTETSHQGGIFKPHGASESDLAKYMHLTHNPAGEDGDGDKGKSPRHHNGPYSQFNTVGLPPTPPGQLLNAKRPVVKRTRGEQGTGSGTDADMDTDRDVGESRASSTHEQIWQQIEQ